MSWLRLLQLSTAVLGTMAKIRYVRQVSIGQGWMPGQLHNRGGWNYSGQLDQATAVGWLPNTNGSICVCDGRNHRVHVYPSDADPKRPQEHPGYLLFGSFGFGPGQVYRPSGCASDGKALYIVDSYNHRLQKFNLSNGRLLRSGRRNLGSGPGQMRFPQGLALTDGVLHVADTRNHRIVSFDTNLRFIFAFGGRRGSEPGELSFPSGVAVIGSTIYVADSGNDRIQVFSTRGKFIRIFAKPAGDAYPFDLPSDVSLAHGRVFVSEFHGKRVQVLTPFGDMLQVLKLPGVGSLSSIDVDTVRGRIYVADHDHHRVHVVAVRGAENYTSTLPAGSLPGGAKAPNAGLNPAGRLRNSRTKAQGIIRRSKRSGDQVARKPGNPVTRAGPAARSKRTGRAGK